MSLPKKKLRRPSANALQAVAASQGGLFTSSQAQTCGFGAALCAYYCKEGRFLRQRRGLYRLPDHEISRISDIFAAWLTIGILDSVVSHQTALELLGLSNSLEPDVHLTVPRDKRRQAPSGVALHTSNRFPEPSQLTQIHGLPVTTAARSIVDSWTAGPPMDLILRATQQALAQGMTTETELIFVSQERPGAIRGLIRRALQ